MRHWLPASAFTVAVALSVALLLPWVVPSAFGAAYTGAVPACIWMAISGPFVVAGRLSVAVLLGQGAFRAAARHALARSLAVPVAVAMLLAAMPGERAAAAALAWLLVEAAAVALGAWLVLRRSGEPA
jgi:O-antigen/teichoic acid export membrane protein